MRRLLMGTVVVLACWIWPAWAEGGQDSLPDRVVCLDLDAKVFRDGCATSNRELGAFNRPLKVSVRSGGRVRILVKDKNPLLFTYGAAVKSEPTEDFQAALTFAKALGTLLERFKAVGFDSGGCSLPTLEGLNVCEFRESLTDVLQWAGTGVGQQIAQTAGPNADIATVKAAVAEWEIESRIKGVRTGYVNVASALVACLDGHSLSAADTEGSRFAAGCQERIDLLARHRQLAAKRENLSRAEAVLAITREKRDNADEQVRTAAGGVKARHLLEALNALVTAAEAGVAEEEATLNDELKAVRAGPPSPTVADLLARFMTLKPEFEKAAALLTEFAARLRDVAPEGELRIVEHSLERQTVTTSIEPSKTFVALLEKPTTERQAQLAAAGKQTIIVEPYRPASIRPGAAFVLGFLRNPVYTAKKTGDAFTIAEESAELTRYNVAAMLHLVPRGWDEPTFGGFIQVGVSPASGETALLLGGGISAQGAFSLGAGVMYQQVRRLAPGLSVGGALASADALKVETPFKPGFFVNATVSLPNVR